MSFPAFICGAVCVAAGLLSALSIGERERSLDLFIFRLFSALVCLAARSTLSHLSFAALVPPGVRSSFLSPGSFVASIPLQQQQIMQLELHRITINANWNIYGKWCSSYICDAVNASTDANADALSLCPASARSVYRRPTPSPRRTYFRAVSFAPFAAHAD